MHAQTSASSLTRAGFVERNKMKFVSVLAIVAFLATPALCGRPLDDLSSWLTAAVKLDQSQLSEPLTADKPWFCHDLDCPNYKVRAVHTGLLQLPCVLCGPRLLTSRLQVTNHSEIYETRAYEKGACSQYRLLLSASHSPCS